MSAPSSSNKTSLSGPDLPSTSGGSRPTSILTPKGIDSPYPLQVLICSPTTSTAASSSRNNTSDYQNVIQSITERYDQLPLDIQSKCLFSLLQRTNRHHLQIVSSILLTNLKHDFFAILPYELCILVLYNLDAVSLCRASQVSRRWSFLIKNESLLWKNLLSIEGWYARFDRHLEMSPQTPLASSPSIKSNNSPHHSSHSHDVHQALSQHPINPQSLFYMSQYRRKFILRRNWFTNCSTPLTFPGHGNNVVTSLTADDEFIISGSDDQTINIYFTKTGVLYRTLAGHDGGVWCLGLHGDYLVSGSTDRTIRVWSIRTGKCVWILRGHSSTIRCLAVVSLPPSLDTHEIKDANSRGFAIISGSRDAAIRVWHVYPHEAGLHSREGAVSIPPLDHEPQVVNGDPAVVVSDDGPPISSTTNSFESFPPQFPFHAAAPSQLVHDVIDDQRELHQQSSRPILSTHSDPILSHRSDLIPSEDTDVSMGESGVSDGVSALPICKFLLTGHRDSVRAIDVGEHVVVSGSYDFSVRIWDWKKGKCLHRLVGHTDKVYSVSYNHKLRLAASGSLDRLVRIWSSENGSCLHVMEGRSFHLTPTLLFCVSLMDVAEEQC